MTQVKICGITNVADALAAVAAGADALGFVFADSPRRVEPEKARQIIRALPPFVTTIGVFADAPLESVEVAAAAAGVSHVQLHGAENASYCAALSRPVIKRLCVVGRNTRALAAEMAAYDVSAFLLDPGAGSGRAFDWSMCAELHDAIRRQTPPRDIAIIIAGGLTPHHVADAIHTARPQAVDVCTGVETYPGKKDAVRMKDFVLAVRAADAVYASG